MIHYLARAFFLYFLPYWCGQIRWGFHASFLGHALDTHSRKEKSVFGLVCAAVSPSSVQFQPLLLLALFLANTPPHPQITGWMFAGFYEEQFLHSTGSLALVIWAQFCEHDECFYILCHWSCVC